jgi:hypothetical protein
MKETWLVAEQESLKCIVEEVGMGIERAVSLL